MTSVEAACVVWTSMRHELATILVGWRVAVIIGAIQPVVFLLIALGARDAVDATSAAAVASAVLLTSYWGATVWGGAAILRRERAEGTLAALLVGVRDPRLVLLGKAFGASLGGAVLITGAVAVALLLLGRPVAVADPGWYAVGMLAMLVSGTALGTLMSCLFLLTRYGAQLSSVLMYPVFLLAGLMIPTEVLPDWLRPVSWFISLHWAQRFLVSATVGEPDPVALALVLLLTAGYFAFGAAAFRRISNLVRLRGTLEHG